MTKAAAIRVGLPITPQQLHKTLPLQICKRFKPVSRIGQTRNDKTLIKWRFYEHHRHYHKHHRHYHKQGQYEGFKLQTCFDPELLKIRWSFTSGQVPLAAAANQSGQALQFLGPHSTHTVPHLDYPKKLGALSFAHDILLQYWT